MSKKIEYRKEKNELHKTVPAAVSYYENGLKALEFYYVGGKLHREDGPAAISYYEDGSVLSETYYIKGKKHRDDGPMSTYYPDGTVMTETYYTEGKAHRDDGPAIIYYQPDGSVKSEKWVDHDEEYTPSQEQLDSYSNRLNSASTIDTSMGG